MHPSTYPPFRPSAEAFLLLHPMLIGQLNGSRLGSLAIIVSNLPKMQIRWVENTVDGRPPFPRWSSLTYVTVF